MKILDKDNNEIQNPDLSLGYFIEDKILIASHPAVEAVAGEWHYETVREYPNGGKDVEKVWDIEPVEAKAAWAEYEDIQRYIEYTAEELAEREAAAKAAKERAERIEQLVTSGVLQTDLEELYEALGMILNGVTE